MCFKLDCIISKITQWMFLTTLYSAMEKQNSRGRALEQLESSSSKIFMNGPICTQVMRLGKQKIETSMTMKFKGFFLPYTL